MFSIKCQLSELKVIRNGISFSYQTVMELNELHDVLSKLIGNEQNLEYFLDKFSDETVIDLCVHIVFFFSCKYT